MGWSLTSATLPSGTLSLPFELPLFPPQAEATSATASRRRARDRAYLMKNAPFAALPSGRPARVEYSIDQLERSFEPVSPKRYLPLRRRVDGGIDAAPELAELAGAEDERPECRPAAAEDEVVGAERGELQLRLLDREQVLDGIRDRAEPVLDGGVQLAELVLRLR